MSQPKRQKTIRQFPRVEIIHSMPDAAKRLCDYLRNFVPTTAADSLGQSDFGKKWVGNDVTAELDRFTYLFYGRTTADYERDHTKAMTRWIYPVEGWIVATPTTEEREELARHGSSIQVMHSTYAGWPNQVTRCVDSLFRGMATLRIYFHRGVVFDRTQWIRGGEWLFERWVNLGLSNKAPPPPRIPWFDSDWCRAPLYGSWPPRPYQAPVMQTTSPPVPDAIKTSGLFQQQKTDGLPIEWVESVERYAELLRQALRTNASMGKAETKAKRSTVKSGGDPEALIIAALNEHHQYSNGACEDVGHVGVNQLARHLKLSPSTVSGFFKTAFSGHNNYKIACGNLGVLANSLKMLNGELRPKILFKPLGDNDGNLADE